MLVPFLVMGIRKLENKALLKLKVNVSGKKFTQMLPVSGWLDYKLLVFSFSAFSIIVMLLCSSEMISFICSYIYFPDPEKGNSDFFKLDTWMDRHLETLQANEHPLK